MDICTQKGGLTWGTNLFVNTTSPCAEIEVFSDKIVFKVNFLRICKKEIVLDKNEIVKIDLTRCFIKGFRFYHTSMKADEILIFWSFSLGKLMDNLIEMGYEEINQGREMRP